MINLTNEQLNLITKARELAIRLDDDGEHTNPTCMTCGAADMLRTLANVLRSFEPPHE